MTTTRRLLASLLLLGLFGCATSSVPLRQSKEVEEPEPEAVEMPEQVASALLLGGARAQAGDLDGALGYYRYAHEQLPDDVHIAIRYADTALQKGHPREALGALNRAARANDPNEELETRRIRIQLGLGNVETAIEMADAAVEALPESADLLDLLALSLEHGGDSSRLLEVYEKLADLRPGDREVNRRLVALTAQAEEPKRARGLAERLLREDADDPELLALYVELLAQEDQAAEVEPFLRELLELHPSAMAPRTQLADHYLREGDADAAVAVLLPVAKEGELSWGPRMLLADLLLRLDRTEEARELIDELLAEGHEATLLFRLAGELAQRDDDLEGAERWYRRAVKSDETDLDAHMALLLVLSQLQPEVFDPPEEPGEEINQFNRLLTRADALATPDSYRYDYLLGTLLRRTGRYGEALRRLERASEHQPESEDALYDLAVCQEELERYADAKDTLERLLQLQPEEAHYLNFYGYLLAERGWELERAESMILAALEDDPDNPYYLDSLGWVYYQTGRFEQAYSTLTLAMDGLGEDPVILEHVGDALRALGQDVEALEMYRRALENGGEEVRLRPRVEDLEASLRENP